MEGRVYVCSWKQTPAGFSVWVRSRPAVRAEGATFAAADEALWAEILAACGDGENVRQYDPPEPLDAKLEDFLSPRLVTVVGNAMARTINLNQLYDGGVCSECRSPRGPRTGARAQVADIESGSDGGFTNTFRFFSDAFVALLTPAERKLFEWRPIDRPEKRSRKPFVELIPLHPIAPVAVHGLPFDALVCRACGNQPPVSVASPGLPSNFICRDDLPRPEPGCFATVSISWGEIGFSFERWRKMIGKPGTRGLIAFDLGVVSGEQCERNPPRRGRDEA